MLRYAHKIRLIVKGQSGNPERLLPPVLELSYSERKPIEWIDGGSDADAMRVAELKFEVARRGSREKTRREEKTPRSVFVC